MLYGIINYLYLSPTAKLHCYLIINQGLMKKAPVVIDELI
jgi:hypothetical protein